LKLLVDENLPPRLASDLADLFPESVHVSAVGLGGTSDSVIWEYAKAHRPRRATQGNLVADWELLGDGEHSNGAEQRRAVC